MIGTFSERILLGLLCWDCGAYVGEEIQGAPRLCRDCIDKDRYHAALYQQVKLK